MRKILKPNARLWLWSKILAVVLSLLTFTPLIIPAGQHRPFFLGTPYTLWSGLLLTALLVLLTWVGTRVHPAEDEPDNPPAP